MDVPIPESSERSSLLGKIDAFLSALEEQGIKISIDQRVWVHVLLLKLISNGFLPENSDKLCPLITPILAGTPTQQLTCETTFRALWVGALPEERESPARTKDVRVEAPPDNRARGLVLAKRFGRILIVAAAALALIGLCFFFVSDHRLHPSSEYTPDSHNALAVTLDSDWLKNYPIDELAPPQQAPWNRTLRWYYTEYDVKKWTALLLPWAACVGFMVYIYLQWLAFLRRSSLKQNLRLLDWSLNTARFRFGDRQLVAELQPLRGLARSSRSIFDADRTALASAAAAGQLTSRFKEIVIPTDFVVLINRQSSRDHLAAYGHELAKTLQDAGLAIEVFEFNGDLSLCHDARHGDFIGLGSLVRRFPDSVLLVFASASQLVDPARGNLLPSALALRDARRAILLKPEPIWATSDIERALIRALGITAFPATPDGIRAMVRFLLPAGTGAIARERGNEENIDTRPLDNFFQERPGRWMQKIAPSAGDLLQLKEHLARFLPPHTTRWLAAASIYPELRWPLTLSLKSATFPSGTSRLAVDGDLMAVSRLPWFRSGWMPDWTRNFLQSGLSDSDRKLARQTILDLMGANGRRPAFGSESMQLNIAGDHQPKRDAIAGDKILLDYLLPGLPDTHRLFALPPTLIRGLLRKPLRRMVTLLVAVTIVTVTMSFGAVSLLPIDECDLLAASDADDFRVGPPTSHTALRVFTSKRALAACKRAVAREPDNGRFHYQLARAQRASFADSHASGLKAAALGYPAGYNSVGFDFDLGEGVPRDAGEAERNYEIAVRLGNLSSLNNLAILARERNDRQRAFELFSRYVAAGGDNTEDLALSYLEQPDIVPKDIAHAVALLELGVKRRNGHSARRLGYYIRNGQLGLARDPQRALELYELAVKWSADDAAAGNLARLYRDGTGTEVDMERATYWAIFAAKLKNSDGFEILADLLESGRAKFKAGYAPPTPFVNDEIKRTLAEVKEVNRHLELGRAMEKKGELSQAIDWYRKAADKGDTNAAAALKRLLPRKEE